MKHIQEVRPWKLLSSQTALDEKWFPVRKDTVQLPSGKIIDDYFVWESPPIVAVVPITPEGKFVLVRQYRHAMNSIRHQFPAGAVDKNETAEQAVLRELKEESGYTTTNPLVRLGIFAPYATKVTGTEEVFLALDATFVEAPPYDEQEESEVVLMTEQEIWDLLESDETHMMTLAAGFLMALRHLKKL